MIDLHCHILPGLDDGPKTMEESVEMAEAAIADGITHLVATPHSSTRIFFRLPENPGVVQRAAGESGDRA